MTGASARALNTSSITPSSLAARTSSTPEMMATPASTKAIPVSTAQKLAPRALLGRFRPRTPHCRRERGSDDPEMDGFESFASTDVNTPETRFPIFVRVRVVGSTDNWHRERTATRQPLGQLSRQPARSSVIENSSAVPPACVADWRLNNSDNAIEATAQHRIQFPDPGVYPEFVLFLSR